MNAMSKDDIVRMALEAGFKKDNCGVYQPDRLDPDADCSPELERFAALVAAAEREACAELCEERADEAIDDYEAGGMHACAAAIQARGGK